MSQSHKDIKLKDDEINSLKQNLQKKYHELLTLNTQLNALTEGIVTIENLTHSN